MSRPRHIAAQGSPPVVWGNRVIAGIQARLSFCCGMRFSPDIALLIFMSGWPSRERNTAGGYCAPHGGLPACIWLNGPYLRLSEDRAPIGGDAWPSMSGQSLQLFGVLLHELLHDASRGLAKAHHGRVFYDYCVRANSIFHFAAPSLPSSRITNQHPTRWPGLNDGWRKTPSIITERADRSCHAIA